MKAASDKCCRIRREDRLFYWINCELDRSILLHSSHLAPKALVSRKVDEQHGDISSFPTHSFVTMSFESGHYSIEELLALRESPLVTKPDLPPQMEQWITQPAIERRNLQNSQSQ